MPLLLLLSVGCLSTSGIVQDIEDGQIQDLDSDQDGTLAKVTDTGLDLAAPVDTGVAPGPSTPAAGLLWAWTDGTALDDRPTAIAMLDDGGLLVGGYLGAGPLDDDDQRAELVALTPDGTLSWRTTLATASASLVVDELLPTSDGGAWVCASALTSATLSPELGELPESWSSSLTLVRVDDAGRIAAVAGLGVTNGGELAAGCGRDATGALVIDGSVDSGELQLMVDGATTTLANFGPHGFVVALGDDGTLRSASTWHTGPQRRQAGAVRPDGSVVQLLRYTGDPGVVAGGRLLTPCPGAEVCTGLVSIDAVGQPAWTATMGPGVGADAHLVPTADGGLLLAADLGDSGLLPQADGDPVADGIGGRVVAAWSPELVLEWLVHVSEQALVTTVHSTATGSTWIGLWTDAAATLQVGDGVLPVVDAGATLALARIDWTGHTDWLWTASGSGDAWPTALAGTEDTLAVATVFRGELDVALGDEEVALTSLPSAGGLPTNDLGVLLLTPDL